MLRIVGVQRSDNPDSEYVLLQNHGVLRTSLRGHLLASEAALMLLDASCMYSFTDDEPIPSHHYVALISGKGQDGWRRGGEGWPVYHIYWGRTGPVWSRDSDPVHLLNVAHTFRNRPEGLLVGR